MKFNRAVTVLVIAIVSYTPACAAMISIPTVRVGNPGNPPRVDDSHPHGGVGAVAYSFLMGKTEVTNAQYTVFLNAVAATDTYGLYHPNMGSSTHGGILRNGVPGSFTYQVKPPALDGAYPYEDKPIGFVSWGDATRFANWLHNGQPTGAQDASTTEDGAYALNGAVTLGALATVTRNPGAQWWIPSEDEWFKAAYHKNDGPTGNYWLFPMGTDSVPNNNPPELDTGNSANFKLLDQITTGNSSFPMTDAGAYIRSSSPYGTFDQGGNVWEWNDTLFHDIFRGLRGGAYDTPWDQLRSTFRYDDNPSIDDSSITGFRVASIPEPGTACLWMLGTTMILLWSGGRTNLYAQSR